MRSVAWGLSLLLLSGGFIVSPLQAHANQIAQSVQGSTLEDALQLAIRAEEYKEQGKYSEAIPFAEESLRIRRELLSNDDPLLATSLNNLGPLYWNQGRYEEAEPLFRDCPEFCVRDLESTH